MCTSQDLSKIPISALRTATISSLSAGLNRHKIIANEEGLPRDWRGLAHLIGLNGTETSKIGASNDPTAALILKWTQQGTVDQLQKFLAVIDRFDVLDDSKGLIEKDVEIFLERSSAATVSENESNSTDSVILTVDDVGRLEMGLDPQKYDAYLLYADEDVDFALKIVDTMEKQYHMKFCIRDRDLVGGIAFQHEAIMKLIAERCQRLLVVVTSSFLRSSANKFFVTFAQALGIDQRQRKVIPILYEKCELPPELSYYFLLDYSRAGVLWNFWEKLRDSIQTPDVTSTSRSLTSSPWISKPRTELHTTPIKASLQTQEQPATVLLNTREETKKPLLKIISSSITNLVLSKDSSDKNVTIDSGYQSTETKSKGIKRKWFKKKKAEPLLS